MSETKDTKLVHGGRDAALSAGAVNLPVWRASTFLFDDWAGFQDAAADKSRTKPVYGRIGTPPAHALESLLAELEDGAGSVLFASGLAAITSLLLAHAKTGGHILLPDTIYGPGRDFADAVLGGLGIEIEYYDPLIAGGIAALIRPQTGLVYMESPGHLTMEIQDVPAIAAAARAAGVPTAIDSSWATPLGSNPIAFGVDFVLHAGTKYLVGHADAMMGAVIARDADALDRLRRMQIRLGNAPGADEIFLTLRGLRTLSVRLDRHEASALTIARHLADRPEVASVLYPPLPGAPGHALWRRDHRRGSGLMSLLLRTESRTQAIAFVESLKLFAIGASWGGFESLAIWQDPGRIRTARPWPHRNQLVRLHVGLEDAGELVADLAQGLDGLA